MEESEGQTVRGNQCWLLLSRCSYSCVCLGQSLFIPYVLTLLYSTPHYSEKYPSLDDKLCGHPNYIITICTLYCLGMFSVQGTVQIPVAPRGVKSVSSLVWKPHFRKRHIALQNVGDDENCECHIELKGGEIVSAWWGGQATAAEVRWHLRKDCKKQRFNK